MRILINLISWITASFIWYWPTRRAGWVTDILGLLPRLEEQGWGGVWMGYNSPNFHPLTLGLHNALWQNFGSQSLGYYFVFTGLHGLCASLIFIGVKKISLDFQLARAGWAAFLAASIFLVHPYVNEVVIWKAALNYLLCSNFTLLACGFTYMYASTFKKAYLLYAGTAVLAALLSFDLALILPVLLVLAAMMSPQVKRLKPLNAWLHPLLLSLGLVLFYLLVKSMLFETTIGHYGASVHLNTDPILIVGNLWRQLLKLLFLTRELSFSHMMRLDQTLGQAVPLVILSSSAALVTVILYLRRDYLTIRTRLVILFALSTLVALLPIANLFAYWIQSIEGDRYSYLAICFAAPAVSIAMAGLAQHWLRHGLSIGILFVLAYYNSEKLMIWAENAYTQQQLVQNFAPFAERAVQNDRKVLLLGAAENYQGSYLFRDGAMPYQSFGYSNRYLGGFHDTLDIKEVAGFNQVMLSDSVSAWVNVAGEVELRFRQGGNWWWRAGIGMSDYETEEYRVTAGDPLIVCFTPQFDKNTILLYQTGLTWTELSTEGIKACSKK